MKNRSGIYGKTRKTLPLVEDPAELWRGGGRARVGVKGLRGVARRLRKQSSYPSP
jgi:hypothetical protein